MKKDRKWDLTYTLVKMIIKACSVYHVSLNSFMINVYFKTVKSQYSNHTLFMTP